MLPRDLEEFYSHQQCLRISNLLLCHRLRLVIYFENLFQFDR